MHQRMAGCALAVLAAATLGAPARARAQGTFEGTVVGTMSMPDGKSGAFRYSQLGSRVRQEFTFSGHTAASITDGTTGDMISIMPEQKKYMVINMRTAGAMARGMAGAMGGGRGGDKQPDFSKVKVTPTGVHETIAGIPCDHYLFQNTEETDAHPVDMCGATGLGFMGMAGQANSMIPSTVAMMRAQNPELARIARNGFFPLKMTFSERQHPERTTTWTVTQIDRHRPDAALFQPPAGYTEMKIPAMPGH